MGTGLPWLLVLVLLVLVLLVLLAWAGHSLRVWLVVIFFAGAVADPGLSCLAVASSFFLLSLASHRGCASLSFAAPPSPCLSLFPTNSCCCLSTLHLLLVHPQGPPTTAERKKTPIGACSVPPSHGRPLLRKKRGDGCRSFFTPGCVGEGRN